MGGLNHLFHTVYRQLLRPNAGGSVSMAAGLLLLSLDQLVGTGDTYVKMANIPVPCYPMVRLPVSSRDHSFYQIVDNVCCRDTIGFRTLAVALNVPTAKSWRLHSNILVQNPGHLKHHRHDRLCWVISPSFQKTCYGALGHT